jgi:hypothetical protein
MKKFGFAAAVASGLAAALIGLGTPAQAAPSGTANAQDTISQLEAEGFTVIVNRLGNTPLDKATVVAIRRGQSFSFMDSGFPAPGDDVVNAVVKKVVYVDIK